jgi:hypothetical protein
MSEAKSYFIQPGPGRPKGSEKDFKILKIFLLFSFSFESFYGGPIWTDISIVTLFATLVARNMTKVSFLETAVPSARVGIQ